MTVTDPGAHYRRCRERLTGLLDAATEDEWNTPVAACPGWRVHDVVGHLVGVIEDVMAGTLTGPPPEEQTAEQVERHRDDQPRQLLALWGELAGPFEKVISDLGVFEAALDLLTTNRTSAPPWAGPGRVTTSWSCRRLAG